MQEKIRNMNDEKAQQLGAYIRHMRKVRGLDNRELARRAKVDSGGLTRIEQGQIHNPKPRTLCAIATALDLPAADLFALAGYTSPRDLPSIEHYLNTKYSHIPTDHTWPICQAVERLSAIYQEEPPAA